MSSENLPATVQVKAEVEPWPERAKVLVVTDDASYMQGAGMLADIKGLRRKVNDAFDPIIEAAHQTHKKAVASKREVEHPLVTAEGIIKDSMGGYAERLERERRERERAAEQAAREAAEAARKAAEAAARENARPQTVERAAEKAAAAEAVAQQAAEQAAEIERPKAAGTAAVKTWSAQVTDLRALIQHVAAHPEFTNLLVANDTALNALARAQKEGFSMPGVRAVSKTSIRAT